MPRCSLLMACMLVGLLNSAAHSDEIRLAFPADRDCGTVSLCKEHDGEHGFRGPIVPEETVGKARGDVFVPEGSIVSLSVTPEGSRDLSFLDSLPADAIHSLRVVGATITRTDLSRFARLRSLQALQLQACTISENFTLEEVESSPRLREIDLHRSDERVTELLCNWAAKCPQLETVSKGDYLDSKLLRVLKDHPSITFLNVELAADGLDTLELLSNLPKLRGLNLKIGRPLDDRDLRSLGELRSLALINWRDGEVNAKALKALGRTGNLKVLRLYGAVTLGSDFVSGLAELPSLEALALNIQQHDYEKDELHSVLFNMSKLVEWPELHAPTDASLIELAKRSNLISLDVIGPVSQQAQGYISKILLNNPLRRFSTRDISITPQLAEAIVSCHYIEELSLSTDQFDGNYFRHAGALRNLQNLTLGVSGSVKNLHSLAALPRLHNLQINGSQFRSSDLGFIAASRSLETLAVVDAYVDDHLAELVARSNVSRLDVRSGSRCVMTDKGILKLAEDVRLKQLEVGGFISRAAINRLTQLPQLEMLAIESHLLSEADCEQLSVEFPQYRFTKGDIFVGLDGFNRNALYEASKPHKVEGKSVKELLGTTFTPELQEKLKDQFVLIDFWGSWCGICIDQFPTLVQIQEKYGGQGFTVLAIQCREESWEAAAKYLTQHAKPWPNIEDRSGDIAKRFGVRAYPSLYLVDRQGIVRVANIHIIGLDNAVEQVTNAPK